MESIRFVSVTFILALGLQAPSVCGQNATRTVACEFGECISVARCPVVRAALSLNNVNSTKNVGVVIDIMRQHRCGTEESVSATRICCTDLAVELIRKNLLENVADGNSTLSLARLMTLPCGMRSNTDSTPNGQVATLDEFPWMALLEYNTTWGRGFLCAGSLISDRYVLTAAHCFISPDARLISVRLGEYDTSTTIDCEIVDGTEVCAPPVEDHSVEEVIIHREFRSRLLVNDVALIRLRKKVSFRDRIQPICLPLFKDAIRKDSHAIAAGWGFTSSGATSNLLQKASLPVLPNDFCERMFARNFTSSHICVGGRRGVDTCRGDSGGPLFSETWKTTFAQYGILSGGGVVCGGNNTIPSIYTNVVEYIPWIVKNIKP